MSRIAQSQRSHDAALLVLANIIARHARRIPGDERSDIVDALVELGFDDSDDPMGLLATIEMDGGAA